MKEPGSKILPDYVKIASKIAQGMIFTFFCAITSKITALDLIYNNTLVNLSLPDLTRICSVIFQQNENSVG